MNRRLLAVVGIALVLASLAVSAWAWFQLPGDAEIATHFGPTGAADRYSSKAVGLLMAPGIQAGVLLLLIVLPSIEPRRANLARSGRAYTAVALGALAILSLVHAASVAVALGWDVNITRVVLIGVGLLFVVIGYVLPRVHSNFMFGFRTPWTLTSEASWTRTHRLGGLMFMLFGVALVLSGSVLPTSWITPVLLGGVAVVVLVPTVYSYLVWRSDPDRTSAAPPR